jgi:hypothetical protein
MDVTVSYTRLLQNVVSCTMQETTKSRHLATDGTEGFLNGVVFVR